MPGMHQVTLLCGSCEKEFIPEVYVYCATGILHLKGTCPHCGNKLSNLDISSYTLAKHYQAGDDRTALSKETDLRNIKLTQLRPM